MYYNYNLANWRIVCIVHQGTRYSLVDITPPATGDFILLETINKDKTATRTIYIIMPTPDKALLKVGRGHEADVRISDISVSRLHAQIKCMPDGYYFEDNKAKFGTLLLHNQPIALETDKLKMLQVGRTVIILTQSPVKPQSLAESPQVIVPSQGSPEPKPQELAVQAPSAQPSKPSQGNGEGNQMDDVADEGEPH
jgi:hypothetical protein